MKAPSFLPLKLKRKVNSLLRSVGLLDATTRKVVTRKPRKAKSAPAALDAQTATSANTTAIS